MLYLRSHLFTTAALAAALVLSVAGVLLFAGGARAGTSDPGAMAAMSIDMDPSAAPANTATSLGTRQACARINENNALDADEDTTADTLQFDVTATSIPSTTAMIAFSYRITYAASELTLQTGGPATYLLDSTVGSNVFNANDPLPDTTGSWAGSGLDTSNFDTVAPESGSGVLERQTISTDSGALQGQYTLAMSETIHLDKTAAPHVAVAVNNGTVAVNEPCGGATPPATASPTASPTIVPATGTPVAGTPTGTPMAGTPTATPTPGPTQSGGATAMPTPTGTGAPTPTPTVTPSPTGSPGDTGTPDPTGTGGPTPTPTATPTPGPSDTPGLKMKGDIDCDGDIDSVDSLKQLRHVASLSVGQEPGCPEIGAADAIFGDVDCDGDVDSVDALKVLRFVASLAVTLPQGCTPIGT